MKDAAVVLLLSLSVATMVTAYVSTVYGLLWRPPRWRAFAALLCPVLAPYFGLREGMRTRAIALSLSVAVYAITFFLGARR